MAFSFPMLLVFLAMLAVGVLAEDLSPFYGPDEDYWPRDERLMMKESMAYSATKRVAVDAAGAAVNGSWNYAKLNTDGKFEIGKLDYDPKFAKHNDPQYMSHHLEHKNLGQWGFCLHEKTYGPKLFDLLHSSTFWCKNSKSLIQKHQGIFFFTDSDEATLNSGNLVDNLKQNLMAGDHDFENQNCVKLQDRQIWSNYLLLEFKDSSYVTGIKNATMWDFEVSQNGGSVRLHNLTLGGQQAKFLFTDVDSSSPLVASQENQRTVQLFVAPCDELSQTEACYRDYKTEGELEAAVSKIKSNYALLLNQEFAK